MVKKALQLASVASMIDQFNMENIEILQSLGYQVDVVANFTVPGTITEKRAEELKQRLLKMNVRVFDVAIPRSLNPSNIMKAYKRVKEIITAEQYNIIHCHSPIGGVICRQAAKGLRKNGTKLIYTAHGFHFYNGAPLLNWIIYYPIEKHFSKYTDFLITINKEDFKRAKRKFYAKKTIKIPGVGIDTKKFSECKVNKNAKRLELGFHKDDFLLLSVGELSKRKNQRIVIDALIKMKNAGEIDNIRYLAVGVGELKEEFERLINNNDLQDYVKLLGFRTDVDELCETVDCFVHPSIREGLGIAPIEAMSAGLPLISANINGIKDYTQDGISGCCVNPKDVYAMVRAIKKMRYHQAFRKRCGENNVLTAKTFDIENTNKIMKKVYGSIK